MPKKKQDIQKSEKDLDTSLASKEETKTVSSTDVTKKSSNISEPQTMEELLAQTGYNLKGFKKGDIVDGVVTLVGPKEILIDIGGKTEGVIVEKELEFITDFLKNLKVGDKVSCYVVMPENDFGQIVLSLRKAGMDYKWKRLQTAKDNGEEVAVLGLEVNRGGLLVEWEGLRGFIPASQLESSYSSRPQELINRNVQVKVIELDPKQNRLIFTQRGGMDQQKKKEQLSKIKIGETYEGVVTGVAPFGVFVSVNGIEGLVHISEISWEKVNDPKNYFKVGDKVQVLVLGIDEVQGKLNLSVKQLMPNPWLTVAEKYSKDQTVKGKISKIVAYGAFVDLEPGISGLIHVSKLPPDTELIEGQGVECVVESVDVASRRISLSLMLHEKPVGYK